MYAGLEEELAALHSTNHMLILRTEALSVEMSADKAKLQLLQEAYDRVVSQSAAEARVRLDDD